MRTTEDGSNFRLLQGAPPALASRTVMARTAAAFFASTGVAGIVLFAVIPAEAVVSKSILFIGAIVSIATACSVLALGRYLNATAHAGLIVFATIVLTYMLTLSQSPALTVAMACLYPCMACHSAFVFSWRRAFLITAFTVPLCVFGVSSNSELAWWAALLPVTTALIVGTAVAVLSRVASEADTDVLTGLLNRRGFDRALAAALAVPVGSRSGLAMVLFDLDDFKSTNDRLGHRAGDTMLENVAARWIDQLSPDAILARYGGDEFGLLLPNTTEAQAIEIADRMRASITTNCSAGVTSWRHGDTASLFVGRADIGLYRAKATGRNQTTLESAQRPAVVSELRDALDSGTVDVHYQPIVDVADAGRIVGYEALVRWTSIEQPDLTPSGLITIAESSDLIDELGRAVLYRACTDAHSMQRTLGTPLTVNVNVSCLELVRQTYATRALATVAAAGWPFDQLVLEITESELAADSEQAIAQLAQLRRAGVRIAIDDFGSGYSSLNRLASLPWDILKIDRPIIGDAASARPMLTAITALSAAFGLDVIVEGIETQDQAVLAKELGIGSAQGFLYGRAMSLAEITSAIPAVNAAPD
ncbi:bifunctional diguanylate cyclase/phosphodiesterase [Antrihabitans sp. YC3-6]|uniref:Bifunctional diguanylate cyclase/phosphodiesterase n=1 Tax=Antrihabitans stalagmiti TaxID=2799499 RepID=A0A934U4J9_9NOCA|nr:bifunctional diguanylate cyclase/phosphodiesterase [Antrihabitans stalagmiti]MBJ8340605.1 bifunctional diguanylate cyclase/phosphodiesterase [Antrihabitans stalagmiti]